MRHNEFCVVLLVLASASARAQQIPGRDLLDFPLGSLAEGPALSLETSDGFRNPASIMVPHAIRARFSISSLTTGSEQGVAGQIASAAVAVPGEVTAGLSVARASVNDIVRTDTDPQSIGGDVPYNILVVSALAARKTGSNVTTGVALRYQVGQIDEDRRSATGIDAGFVMDQLFHVDGRLGLTSFLWRPGSHSGDGPAFGGAFDARLVGRDTTAAVRAGYSYTVTPGISDEHFLYTSGRLGRWDARVGISRSDLDSHHSMRTRLALGFHYGRYSVGLAREETPLGLAPVYHFTFVTSVPTG